MLWFYLRPALASDTWEVLCPPQDSAPLGVGFWLVVLLGVCLLQIILSVFLLSTRILQTEESAPAQTLDLDF